MSSMLEDIILLNVAREIDSRLPAFIRTFYTHKMSTTDKLMDFKNDIFNNIPKFLIDLDKDEQLASFAATDNHPSLAAVRQKGRGANRGRGYNPRVGKDKHYQNKELYCRLCHKCEMLREILKVTTLEMLNAPSSQHKTK